MLVIIGLIIAGILAGRELIEQTKLRTLFSEYKEHLVSINTFRMKYSAIPGDMKNATAFFSACPAGNVPTGCNGNDDKNIGFSSSNNQEKYRFWQHIYFAGLIKFQPTGVATSSPCDQAGINHPESKAFPTAAFSVAYYTTAGLTGNHMFIGANNPSADCSYIPHNPFISSKSAKEFDTKFDDGEPATGLLKASNGYGSVYSCYSGSYTNSASYYYAANDTIVCSLIFTNIF